MWLPLFFCHSQFIPRTGGARAQSQRMRELVQRATDSETALVAAKDALAGAKTHLASTKAEFADVWEGQLLLKKTLRRRTNQVRAEKALRKDDCAAVKKLKGDCKDLHGLMDEMITVLNGTEEKIKELVKDTDIMTKRNDDLAAEIVRLKGHLGTQTFSLVRASRGGGASLPVFARGVADQGGSADVLVIN